MDISDQSFSLFSPVEFPISFLGPKSIIQKCLTLSMVIYYVVIITNSQVKRVTRLEGITGKCAGG